MGYIENLWIFSALLFGIIAVPGMDMLFVLANALTGGRIAAFAALGGVMLGGVVHTIFGALALGALASLPVQIFQLMIVAGSAYMAWIGISLARSTIIVSAVGAAPSRSPMVAFRQGTITCLLNPKAYLFVLATYPQFVRAEFGSLWAQFLMLAGLTITCQFIIYGSVALAAGKGRDALIGNPTLTIWISRAIGALFIAAGVVTLWHGLNHPPMLQN